MALFGDSWERRAPEPYHQKRRWQILSHRPTSNCLPSSAAGDSYLLWEQDALPALEYGIRQLHISSFFRLHVCDGFLYGHMSIALRKYRLRCRNSSRATAELPTAEADSAA